MLSSSFISCVVFLVIRSGDYYMFEDDSDEEEKFQTPRMSTNEDDYDVASVQVEVLTNSALIFCNG